MKQNKKIYNSLLQKYGMILLHIYFYTPLLYMLVQSIKFKNAIDIILAFSILATFFVVTDVILAHIFCPIRYFDYAKYDGEKLRSYNIINKQKCEVDLQKPVYYAKFRTQTERFTFVDFLAISNDKFIFKSKTVTWFKERVFMQVYDRNLLIVIPFNKDVELMCKNAYWHDVRRY